MHESEAGQLCDADLVRQAKAGDTVAFGILYARYRPHCFGIAKRMLGASGYEDIVQNAMLACYQSLHRVRKPSSFRAYLSSCMRSEVLQYLKKEKKRRKMERLIGASRADPGLRSISRAVEEMDAEELRIVLSTCMDRLEMPCRDLITMHSIEGRSLDEIAAMLGNAKSTVSVRLRKCRENLRRVIALERGAGEYLR